MTADDLATFVARSPAGMVLTMYGKNLIVFREEGIRVRVQSQCGNIMGNTNILLRFVETIQHIKD